MRRQILSGLLSISLLLGRATPVAGGVAFAAPEPLRGPEGESLSADESGLKRIEIRTADDLKELAENCHSESYSAGMEVVLMNDIMLSGTGFTSIPIFDGTFEGNGHLISGYSYSGDGYVTGFFRYLSEDALVENLTLSGRIYAQGGQSVTGGIVGINSGTLKNCHFEGEIRGRSESGGIAGINGADGNIFTCVNEGEINGYYFTGGICGKNYGMVYGCSNEGSLNSSVEWVEEDDAMSGEFLDELTGELEGERRLQTGVDTGGIAGYSRGAVMNSVNEGTVGYEHTGYNIGGIVGRQSGTLSGCTNNGTVLGRKDVGGIVGQMEPYIELTDGETVAEEVHKLHDMINTLLDLMDQDNATVRGDLQTLQSQADSAVDTGDRMTDQASTFANANLDVVNEGSRRISYVLEQLPNVTGNVDIAAADLRVMVEKLRKANEDLYLEGYMTEEEKRRAEALIDEIEKLTEELESLEKAKKNATPGFWVHSVIEETEEPGEGVSEDRVVSRAVSSYIRSGDAWVEVSVDEDGWFQLQKGSEYKLHGDCTVVPIKGGPEVTISGNSYGTEKVKELPGEAKADSDGYYRVTTQGAENAARQTVLMAQIVGDIAKLMVIYAPYLDKAADNVNADVREAMDALLAAADAAGMAQDAFEGINEYLNAQKDLQLVKIDQEWNDNMDSIHQQLDAMSGTMTRLGDHSTEYTTEANQQLRAINDQMNKIYGMIEQDVKDLTGGDKGLIYADISDAELNDIILGKVSGSTNNGSVRGDINIGGIAGSMAIDEEDPEENAAGTSNLNLSGRYTTQNVLQNCTNRGYVTAKNDGAGGVVGFMKSGVAQGCYGYGVVESQEGDYVGGIAGQSLAIIRDSFVLCTLSGKNCVGGVAGYGTTISGCYSMPIVLDYESRCGAVAGQISMDDETHEPQLGKLSANRFVSEVLDGIDQISYLDSAERMSYEELLATAGVPSEFRRLTVSFRVEDRYLGTQQVSYGDPVSVIDYPQVPKMEGKFGRWEELPYDTIMGNLVIRAEYVDSVKVLESPVADEESGKKLALIDRDFDDKAELHIEKTTDPAFGKVGYSGTVCYKLSIKNSDIGSSEEVKLRLYNPFASDKVELWQYTDGSWKKAESIGRGSYVQVNMQGAEGIYCIALPEQSFRVFIIAGCVVAGFVLLLFVIGICRKKRKE